MQQRLHRPVIAGTAIAIVAGILILLIARGIERPYADVSVSRPLVALSPAAYSETEVRDQDIAFYTRRAQEDGHSALDRLTLATLLFNRARATGSNDDVARAESLARKSASMREARNGQAISLLATILMTRHAFREARDVAARADSLEPGTPNHLALLGEIELEIGDYAAAETHFRKVHFDGRNFTIGARLARWYEVSGRGDNAKGILERSIEEIDKRDDLPREQVAWFHYRLGELHLRRGRLAAADSAFAQGLARNPGDVRVLGGLARTALARGEWQRAITFGEEATSIQPDPATLGAVSEAAGALGDSAKAAQYAKAMSVSALQQPGPIHRQWGLFLLDHGTASERRQVLNRARREIRERQDVYGHDLLAWALFRTGQLEEARREMALALSQNTEDVMLTAHASAIGNAGVIARR